MGAVPELRRLGLAVRDSAGFGANALPACKLLLASLLLLLPGAFQAASQSVDAIREELGLTNRLSCHLRKGFPQLLFDFRIHSPYQVTVSTKDLRESQHLILRVWTFPLKGPDGDQFAPPRQSHLLEDRFIVKKFPRTKRTTIQMSGSVALGPGEYRHFLSVDNGEGLGCVMEWKVKAKADDKIVHTLSLQPGEVTDPRSIIFARQQRVPKLSDGLNVAVFVNADNRSWRRSVTDGSNVVALAASLRKLAEDERVRSVAVTMFSLEDQRVLYDQDFAPYLNFRRLGSSIRKLKPGEVDLSDLREKSEAKFFGSVVSERDERIRKADLLFFVGARSPVSDKAPQSIIETLRAARPPASAYLITNPFRWRGRVSRDIVGHTVRELNGKEREIRLPNELAKALDTILKDALERKHAPPKHEQLAY